jgi:hypothetical protein
MSGQSSTGGFCWHCAGVLGCIALASLQALRCCCYRCCAGIVTHVALASLPSLCWLCSQHCKLASAQPRGSHDTFVCMASSSWSLSLPVASLPYPALFHGDLAFDGLADAALASCRHCADVLARIVPASLPALRCCCCRHCIGVIALAAQAPLPLLRWHCCPRCLLRCRQHCKLASAQSRSSRNTCWHHCQHCAVVVAGVAPTLLPSLRRHLCPHCAGVVPLITPTLPPASQTGACPVMTQLQHLASEALLSRSLLLPMALLLYPALVHSNRPSTVWPRQRWLFLALRWRPHPHCTGIIASVELSLLPVLRPHCCQIGLRRSGQCSAGVCRRCAGVSPALRWGHCQVCAVVIVAGVGPALSPLAHRHLHPHRGLLVVAFALPPSSPYVASSLYLVLSMPVLRFLTPDTLAEMHVPFCHDVLVGASHGGCHRLGHNRSPGNSRVCHLELFRLSHLCCRQHHQLVSAQS